MPLVKGTSAVEEEAPVGTFAEPCQPGKLPLKDAKS